MNRAVLASLLILSGCEGFLTKSPPPPPLDPVPEDGGLSDCTPEQAELEKQAGEYLQVTCAHAGCHLPAGPRSPNLAAANLAALSTSGHVSPGHPEASALMFRLTTTDPRLAMPPTQAPAAGQSYVNPAQVELVRRWIEGGARTGCVEAPPPPPADVNAIAQGSLFTCTQPIGLEPRYRRLGSPEWIHAFGGAQLNPAMVANPLSDSRGPYTTFSRDQSLDVTSLQLYLDVLANSRTFSAGPIIEDWSAWYRERTGFVGFACITDHRVAVADVSETCRNDFIDALLTRVLARTPTPGEQAAMRGFLDQKLAAEPSSSERQKTLRLVYEATFVLPGVLFQAEGGSGGALTADEYAQVLTSALSTHAASNFVTGYLARPELGWLPAFRAAQDAGTLDTSALRAQAARVFALENGFIGGEWPATPPARPDLQSDWGNTEFLPSFFEHDPLRARRGRYWLAPRLAGFFREYFDYGKVGSVAKDLPAATSAFDLHDPALHGQANQIATWASASWRIFVGDDPTFTQFEPFYDAQLDDTIARMVVTAERDGQDVFRALLTGTTFRTAASTGGDFLATRPTGCDVDLCARTTRPSGANCCTDSSQQCVPHSLAADGGVVGMCATPTWEALWLGASFPYGGTGAPMTDLNTATIGADVVNAVLSDPLHEQRWKTLPATERSGVLTHPAWLAAHGANAENGPSAVVRGYWIREHLFCESVAGLDLVQLRAQLGGDPTTSARSRLDATFGPNAQELRCSNGACHALMNPLGMPFEIYNHAGFVRAFDHGAPPNGSATIPNWPGRGAVEVDDALELNRLLAEDPHARRCFLRHVFRYFMGRHETAEDACVLADMEKAFAGGSLFAALEALYAHDAMLTRAQR